MDSKPKLIYITSRFPYPLEKGDKLRAYYQLKYLSLHFDIHLISLTELVVSPDEFEMVNKWCKSIHLFKVSKITKYLNTAFYFFKSQPFQVGYFYDVRIHRKIKQLLNDIQPDHIFCQLIRVSEYIKDYHACPKTIDFMDALSKGMERRAEVERKYFLRWFYSTESSRLKRYEVSVFDFFEHHVMISEQDKKAIFHSENARIKVVPNGVDDAFFISPAKHKEYELVFTGNMSYTPNIEACRFLVKSILPNLALNVKLLISGANPTQEVKNFANDKVTVTGWVDDIRESYQKGKIFVAPMFLGTGLQNKLLEAMAMGLPAITTSLANNALGGIPEQDILVANSEEQFLFAINKLLSDKPFYNKIQENGKAFVRVQFSWKTTVSQLILFMKN